jgi:hypothetical protein
MSKIYGVMCDGCKKVDAVSAQDPMYEDKIPRNNWMSVNIWSSGPVPQDKDYSVSGPDLHACSTRCLEELASIIEKATKPSE